MLCFLKQKAERGPHREMTNLIASRAFLPPLPSSRTTRATTGRESSTGLAIPNSLDVSGSYCDAC